MCVCLYVCTWVCVSLPAVWDYSSTYSWHCPNLISGGCLSQTQLHLLTQSAAIRFNKPAVFDQLRHKHSQTLFGGGGGCSAQYHDSINTGRMNSHIFKGFVLKQDKGNQRVCLGCENLRLNYFLTFSNNNQSPSCSFILPRTWKMYCVRKHANFKQCQRQVLHKSVEMCWTQAQIQDKVEMCEVCEGPNWLSHW